VAATGGREVLGEAEIQRVQQPVLVGAPRSGQRRRAADFVGGVFAMLLLPLSIVPVLLLGPSVLRAPVTLGREAWGDVQRLERRLLPPSHRARPAITVSELRYLPIVSLGPVYGRWVAFPQTGRTRPGDPLPGPEGQTR
jgi:hypothetical protein